MNKTVHVAVAVVKDSDGKILLTKRPDHVHQGGLWEFPGGKVEVEETVEQALVRELLEELGIRATNFQPLIKIPHQYSDKTVLLDVWEVMAFSGKPHGKEGQPLVWVNHQQLSHRQQISTEFPLPLANLGIVKALRLPRIMAITGEFTDNNDFAVKIENAINRGAQLLQCRLPKMEANRVQALLSVALQKCRANNIPMLVNHHFNPEINFKADGVHLNSQQLMTTKTREEFNAHFVGASCHNQMQLQQAEKLDLDYVTLSPVSTSKSHPQGQPLGWQTFEQWVSAIKIPVFALGGMKLNDVDVARTHGAQGIAAIGDLFGN